MTFKIPSANALKTHQLHSSITLVYKIYVVKLIIHLQFSFTICFCLCEKKCQTTFLLVKNFDQ